jgi:hypothetical protein
LIARIKTSLQRIIQSLNLLSEKQILVEDELSENGEIIEKSAPRQVGAPSRTREELLRALDPLLVQNNDLTH